MPKTQSTQLHVVLRDRLKARRPEIEKAMLNRIWSVSDPGTADPTYTDGLRTAVSTALDHGLEAVGRSESHLPSVPADLTSQARAAARSGVTLETVLRRYLAGFSLFSQFLIDEAEGIALDGSELKLLLSAQTALLDRLVATVSEEYRHEVDIRVDSSERHRVEQVERLLAGEAADASDLAYRMDANHIGMIALGRRASEAIRDCTKAIDCRLLLIQHGEETVWAWLGATRRFELSELTPIVTNSSAGIHLAVGEPNPGLDGWRLTHQQARAALPIALRGSQPVVRYGDVALLASMLQDPVLVASLGELYLEPLARARDGGAVLRQTLRAYFAAERNTSSTAAALGVSRQTVINRLRAIEERLSRPLGSCAMELEAALRLDDLRQPFTRA